MKLKDLGQQYFEKKFYNPYSLISCWPDDNHYALIGSQKSSLFLKILKTLDVYAGTLNLQWNSVIASNHRPTSSIVQNIDMVKIFENSNILERQQLVLNPWYATDFAKIPKDPQILCISWPFIDYTKLKHPPPMILAVVNHYGACNILIKDLIKNEFSISKILINDTFKDIFKYNIKNITTIKSLEDCVENLCITYCCWTNCDNNDENNISYGNLLCATESGWILAFNIIQWKANFIFKFMTNLKSIKCLKIFTFQTQEGIKKKFLFASNVSGIIKIYEIHDNNIEEKSTLWNKEDKMSCRDFDIVYHENLNKVFVAITKSSHFLVFALTTDGQVCTKVHHYTGNFIITGKYIQIVTKIEIIEISISLTYLTSIYLFK